MSTNVFQWQIITFFRMLLGLHLVYSGAAYVFFGWVPSAFSNEASPVGQFMVALDDVGLYPLVKHVELVLGLLILANRFVPLAAALELPITFVIAYLNIFVEGPLQARHYYTGVQELIINGVVVLGYSGYYRSILAVRARPQWLWQRPEPANDLQPKGQGRGGFSIGAPQMWLFFGVFLIAVMSASYLLGPPDRRLPTRDWLPPVLSFVGMLALFQIARDRLKV